MDRALEKLVCGCSPVVKNFRGLGGTRKSPTGLLFFLYLLLTGMKGILTLSSVLIEDVATKGAKITKRE